MRKEKLPWLLLVTLALGCGENEVTGKVLFEGKPVTVGSVVLVGPDGTQRTSLIGSDGSYHVRGLTAGHTKLAVISINPAAPPADPVFAAQERDKFNSLGIELPPAEDASKWFPLPPSYANVESSHLTADLKRGANKLDLLLSKKS
jgi:hypothetical protein